jgi:hypothetical protein
MLHDEGRERDWFFSPGATAGGSAGGRASRRADFRYSLLLEVTIGKISFSRR